MRILELVLCNCKRLSLKNINFIRIIFTEKMQLILGTNGSGKSTILYHLTPLPANSNDFLKDGYKTIYIEHNESMYLIESTFGPTKHSFQKDNVELNPGGTGAVQKELVKKEFGITTDIHDLLTGITNFTTMSLGDRRYWFNQLSDINYTYAIGFYKRLNDKLRDVVGATKINQARLVQESCKILSTEEEFKIKLEIDKYKKFLNYLLESKPNTNSTEVEVSNRIKDSDSLIIKLSTAIINLRKRFLNEEMFNDVLDIDNAIIEEQSAINNISGTVTTLSNEYSVLENQYNILVKNKVSNTSDIDLNINNILARVSTLNNSLAIKLEYSDVKVASNSFLSIYEVLTDIFDSMKPNIDKKYSRLNYQNLIHEIDTCKSELVQINIRSDKLLSSKREQEHYKNHDPVECPSCKHKWIKNYDDRYYNNLLRDISGIEIEINNKLSIIKQKEDKLTEFKEYFSLYKSYSDITKSWPILNPLWSHISNLDSFFNNPSSINHILGKVKVDLEVMENISRLYTELNSLYQLKRLTDENEQLSLEATKNKLSDIEVQLFNLNNEITSRKKTVSKYRYYKDTLTELNEKVILLKDLLSKSTELGDNLVNTHKKKVVNDIIRIVSVDLSKKEQLISEINIQKAVVNDLRLQIATIDDQVTALRLLVKELSPTDGLIAKGMLGFISNFTKQMNSFMKKVWSYPLIIIPCKPNEDDEIELDYKFEVSVNDGHLVSDVSRCSGGMKEIIDLGFRLVAMKYLGLSDCPIYLDEFSIKLDASHRVAAFSMITDLLARSNFSQIFIVSHFDQQYGSLANTEITILCADNIIVPKNCTFNKHVHIE